VESPKAVASAAPAQKPSRARPRTPTSPSAESTRRRVTRVRRSQGRAFRDGRYGEARRQFDEVAARGGPQAAEAALFAAQSAKVGESCAVAVSLFDQVSTRYPGTQSGYEAQWQAATCYETLGDTERAKRSYQALLDVPSFGERAKASLAQLERADQQQPVEVAARKTAARAAAPPAAAPTPAAKAGSNQKAKPSGPPQAADAASRTPHEAASLFCWGSATLEALRPVAAASSPRRSPVCFTRAAVADRDPLVPRLPVVQPRRVRASATASFTG
jgi:hypothetical protein